MQEFSGIVHYASSIIEVTVPHLMRECYGIAPSHGDGLMDMA